MRFSPGCNCCDSSCGCWMRCWPWPQQPPFTYYICVRPPPEQIREKCYDLVLGALIVTVGSVSAGTCASCNYGGTHCLVYVSHQTTVITTPNPSGPDTQQIYFSEVVWESKHTAGCGPSVSDPLPALTVKFTDDGTTAKWILYLNTTDTLGGVATYEIDASSWQCGYDNTLSKKTDSGQCNVPSTATVGPCEHCLLCTESTPRRMIYEWQIDASGFGDVSGQCTPPACPKMDGTWILGPADLIGFTFLDQQPVLEQCAWSLRTGETCNGSSFHWRLKIDNTTTPPSLTLELDLWDGLGSNTPIGTWKATLTSCTAPVTFTLDASFGVCTVPSTITGTPL